MYETLKKAVCKAEISFYENGCDPLNIGGVSAADRHLGIIVLKPDLPYSELNYEKMTVVSLETGEIIEGEFGVPADFSYHYSLYSTFPSLETVAHSYSGSAVAWAQAGRSVPVAGELHRAFCNLPIRCINSGSGEAFGSDVKACFEKYGTDIANNKAVLLSGSSAFCFGDKSLDICLDAVNLEKITDVAFKTEMLKLLTEKITVKHSAKEI